MHEKFDEACMQDPESEMGSDRQAGCRGAGKACRGGAAEVILIAGVYVMLVKKVGLRG